MVAATLARGVIQRSEGGIRRRRELAVKSFQAPLRDSAAIEAAIKEAAMRLVFLITICY